MRRPKWLIVASHVWHNFRYRVRWRLGDFRAEEGATHRNWSLPQSLDYIHRVLREYLEFGGITEPELAGKSILELGPGDNLGVALMFIAAGAERVVCLDKVFSIRDPVKEQRVYAAIRESCSPERQRRIDVAIDISKGIQFNPSRIRYIYGQGVETADRSLSPESFDLVVSRAVLMEIHEKDIGFRMMDRLLRPGGLMIHQIAPCHDYGMFSGFGYHPLEYLTLPPRIYAAMAHDSCKPNRRMIGDYRSVLHGLGYSTTVHVTDFVGSVSGKEAIETPERRAAALALVEEIRPRLSKALRQVPAEELLIRGAFLVARKAFPA